jgi:hypothetical protein
MIALIYFLAVCAGTGVLSTHGTAERQYWATRHLDLNHRIVPGDFRKPDGFPANLGFYLPPRSAVEGKYVRKTVIEPNQSIDPAILDEKPTPVSAADEQVVVFPLSADSGLAAVLDAGFPVVVMGKNDDQHDVVFAAAVHAILCDAKKGEAPSCRAVLRIAAGQSVKLPKDLSGLRLVVQRLPPPA